MVKLNPRLVEQLVWVSGGFAVNQGLRLVSNVILARLLAPQLFGIMLIINTLRTGVELLSDIGIGQNIVSNPKGDQPAFYNTAWTIQIIRGFLLALVGLALAIPVMHFYEEPALGQLIPAMAILFILTGLQSPSRFLLQKSQDVKTNALFDVATGVFALVVTVALASVWPTIWALMGGLLLSTLFSTVASFFLMDFRLHRLMIDRAHVYEILHFGKWVFLSSIVFFLSMNWDRLYFAKAIPFAALGVYGVARTFADMFGQLAQRVGGLLVFPKVAAAQVTGRELKKLIAGRRNLAMALVAVGLSFIISISDMIVLTLYDNRYHGAAFVLPILMGGMWFSVLATTGESVLLGAGRPAHTAYSNMAKLIWLVVAMPLAMARWGVFGALVVIAVADAVRYLSLSVSQVQEKLSFVRVDILLTLLLVALAVGFRLLWAAVGLVETPMSWWEHGVLFHD